MKINLKNLETALAAVDFGSSYKVGPKGDINHHLYEVFTFTGNDEYYTDKIAHLAANALSQFEHRVLTPNRGRGLGGVVVVFESEDGYLWGTTYLFHKGMVYSEDVIIIEEQER